MIDSKVPRAFTYDHVGDPNMSQEDLFELVGRPIADACLGGYNGTIFAYGQTGSGKTFTIQGGLTDHGEEIVAQRGLIPRVLHYIFNHIEANSKSGVLEYLCKCSYLEIYQEKITDLFNPNTQAMQIREDIKKGVYVENLTEREVHSPDEAYAQMRHGARHRHVAPTLKNKQSSRSHSIFTLYIESKETKPDGAQVVKYSRLHMIDLAGSERQSSTGATGQRLKEAAQINKSLLTLGNVIRSLEDAAESEKEKFIQYRDSRLTFLLKDSLGGNSKTTIVATVSPAVADVGESLSTLKFAQRAKRIKNNAIINEDSTGTVNQLKLEIQRLREELNVQKAFKPAGPVAHFLGTQTMQKSASTGSMSASASATPEASGATQVDLLTAHERIRQLEKLLKESLESTERAEDATKGIEAVLQRSKEANVEKEYFVQVVLMRLALRGAALQQMKDQKLAGTELAAILDRDAELRRDQLQHDPRIVEKEVEVMQLEELLMAYDGDEIARLQALAADLSQQTQKLIADKHALADKLRAVANSGSPAAGKAQSVVQLLKAEQKLDEVKAQLDEAMAENLRHEEKEINLEADVMATAQMLEDTQEQLSLAADKHARELEIQRQDHTERLHELRREFEAKVSTLQQGSQKQEQETGLAVLTLKQQLAQAVAERDRLTAESRTREGEFQLLRKNLTQKQIENRRMSVCFGTERSRASIGFGQAGMAAMLEATRDESSEAGGVAEAEVRRRVAAAVKKQQEDQAATVIQLTKKHDEHVREVQGQAVRKLEELKNENAELKEQIETSEEEAKIHMERAIELNEKCHELEAKLDAVTKQNQALEEDRRELRRTLEESQQTMRQASDQKLASLVEQKQALSAELAKAKLDHELATEELAKHAKEVEALHTTKTTLTQDLEASRREQANVADLLVQANAQVSSLEKKTTQFKTELEIAEASIVSLTKDLEESESLRKRIEELSAEVDDYKDAQETMIEETKQQHEQIKALNATLKETRATHEEEKLKFEETALSEHTRDVEERMTLQREVESAQVREEATRRAHGEQIELLQTKFDQAVKQVKQLRHENEGLVKNLHAAHQALTQSSEKSNEGASAVAVLTQRLAEKEKEYLQAKTAVETLEADGAGLKAKLQEQETRLKQLKAQEAKWLVSSKKADGLRDSQNKKIADLVKAKETLNAQLLQAREAKSASETKLSQCLESFANLNMLMTTVSLERKQFGDRIMQYEQEHAVLRKQTEAAMQEKEEMSDKLNKFVGHGNAAQKIKYHQKVKEERDILHEKHQYLRAKVIPDLEAKVARLEIENKRLNGSADQLSFNMDEETRLKELIDIQEKEKRQLAESLAAHRESLITIQKIIVADEDFFPTFNSETEEEKEAIKGVAKLKNSAKQMKFQLQCNEQFLRFQKQLQAPSESAQGAVGATLPEPNKENVAVKGEIASSAATVDKPTVPTTPAIKSSRTVGTVTATSINFHSTPSTGSRQLNSTRKLKPIPANATIISVDSPTPPRSVTKRLATHVKGRSEDDDLLRSVLWPNGKPAKKVK